MNSERTALLRTLQLLLSTRLGLQSLQRRWPQADLISAFKIFTGLLVTDPNLFFLPPARSGLRGHPYRVLQGASHCRRRGSACSVRGVKYCNKLPASVVTAPLSQYFQETIGESSERCLSPSPLLTDHSSPHYPTPPPFHLHTPINSYHLYIQSTSLNITSLNRTFS